MHVGVQCIGHVSHVSPILRVSVDVIEIKIKEQHFIFAVQLVSPRVVKKTYVTRIRIIIKAVFLAINTAIMTIIFIL